MKSIKFYIFCFLFTGTYSSSSKIEYYKTLIDENLAEMENFNPTESSEEFRGAANSTTISDFGEYDFVIIGAGSAGSVLATRLSEIENFKILLLEAGDDEDDFNEIPDAVFALQTSKRNWAYLGVPNNSSCLTSPNHRCQISRGKGIGGSSSINGLIYTRGSKENYNKWARLGNRGWSYKDVLPYFIKSENSQVEGDPGYHGKGGLLNVEKTRPTAAILQNFLDACAEVNLPERDYNGREIFGSGQISSNIMHGRRMSTGQAFLIRARQRKNLKVVTRALATKIRIQNGKAQGVEFLTYDRKYFVRARKEVIVSSGAINSPQLLMLSGIGPREHLNNFGINVVKDLPVGRNVKEHAAFFLAVTTSYIRPWISMEEQIQQYLDGYGPFTPAAGCEGLAFFKTDRSAIAPTHELTLFPPSVSAVSNFTGTYGFQSIRQLASGNTSLIMISLLDGKSTGEITLRSKDPLDYPNINENLFSNPSDVADMRKAIRFTLKLLKTKAFKKIDAQVLFSFGICEEFDQDSDQFWDCLIYNLGGPSLHLVGSTRMGTNPRTSVVDPDLRVHGVGKLRVVDAGVMPTLISGHPNAPTIMIAEKISDRIKAFYRVL